MIRGSALPRPRRQPARAIWLTTLADLSLLLVGFFALIQATRPAERPQLVEAIRSGFTDDAPPAMPLEMAAVGPFTAGDAAPPATAMAAAAAWARDAARDPRTTIQIVGFTDAKGDVDAATGSAPLLAADRARAVAAALVRAGAIDPGRIAITASPEPHGRAVQLRLTFSGHQP